ncbi:MAG: chemotaxis protein MotA [Myxococcota bacterium]|jgi:chemotaxis protein MotA
MDLGTVVGLVLAFVLIISAMMLGGGVAPFIDAQSALIVIGGTFAATMVCQKLPYVVAAMKLLMQAIFDKTSPMDELIPVIIHLAAKARKEGLVALEGETIDDPFMARGVRLGVDGLSPEIIKSTLDSELAAMKTRHERGQAIWKFMCATAPSMGLIGTIVGLVQMLQNLDDPDSIGPAMAVALLTTLYGAILAFVIFGPVATKLAARTADEVSAKKLTIVGVESILKGDNTMVIQSKLEAFLSPEEREKLAAER